MDQYYTHRSPGGIEHRLRAHVDLLNRNASGPFGIDEAQRVLGLRRARARSLLAYLAGRGWLVRVDRGLYSTVPLGAEDPGRWAVDPWQVAAASFAPCYIGGWTALENWDLTEQLFRDVVVVTAGRVRTRVRLIQGVKYRLKHRPEGHLFGTRRVWRDRVPVDVSDPERTIVDVLDDPAVGGGIRHVADCLASLLEGSGRPGLLIDYGERLGNRTVFKRLGFLLESGGLGSNRFIKQCRARISRGLSPLDPTVSDPGKIVKRWNLRVNVVIGR